jgi:CRISPR-associated protein Cas2
MIIVSYDIVDNKKRTQLAKKLLNFGQRVQYSVFECNLTKNQIVEMKTQILPLVDLEKDSLKIYRLCDQCRSQIQSFGIKKNWDDLDKNQTIVL